MADAKGARAISRHIACLTFDLDAMSGWVARRMTTPTPVSRGEFGVIGATRVLALLDKYSIRSTWFVPGVVIEDPACVAKTYPGFWRDLAAAGLAWLAVPAR